WARDGQSLFLDEHHIKIADIKALMQFTIREVERTWEPLIKRSPLPMNMEAFPLEHLVDSPANTAPGFWFGVMTQNSNLLDINAYANSTLPAFVTTMRTNSSQGGTWAPVLDVEEADKFLALERVWLLKLLLFVHLCSGMPARMSELTETTLTNGIGGRPRSITLSPGGEVTLDLTYHKSEWASSRLRHNTRVLHPLAGRMLAFYMCTVMQLTNTLFRLRYGTQRTYLWSAIGTVDEENVGKIAHAQVSRELEYLCGASGLGFTLTISEWRHFAEAVAHKYFRTYEVKRWLDAWRAHNQKTDWSNDAIMTGYEVDEHQIDEFGRRAQDGIFGGNSRYGTSTQDPWSMQSGRHDLTSWRVYGRSKDDRPGQNGDTHAAARMASLAWAEFFGLLAKPAEHGTGSLSGTSDSRGMSVVPLTAVNELASNVKNAVMVQVQEALTSCTRRFLTDSQRHSKQPPARFPLDVAYQKILTDIHGAQDGFLGLRSQAVADTLSLMAQSGTNVVCIAPTGSGKGTIWKLATAAIQGHADRMVLLVIPYRALMASIVHACAELNYAVATWSDEDHFGTLPAGPVLLLVSLNKAVSKNFLAWIQQPVIMARIDRVIVDETHVLLDERSFRL
ncbi:hypothetical protein OC846_006858, partial [Tilletia horrida]